MSLSDLAAIGSLVSGLAVLVSLAYMSLQLRQTEKNQRAILNQGALSRTTDVAIWTAELELAALINQVCRNETDFSNEELWRLTSLFRVNVIGLQDAYVQHTNSLVDRATLEIAVRGFEFWMRRPIMRAMYKVMRENIAADVRPYLDKVIEALPLGEPLDLKRAVQSQLSR